MRFTVVLLFGLLLFRCSEPLKEKSESSLIESMNSDSLEVYSESNFEEDLDTLTYREQDDQINTDEGIITPVSTNVYVNVVRYFKETNEYYVPLYFNEGYSYDDLPSIRLKLDSVISRDSESERKRLPLEEGREYFDLHLLDQLRIYDYRHSLISTSLLKRVEYLDGPIESEFIAVFDAEYVQEEYQFYGIGGEMPVDPGFRSRKIRTNPAVIEKARQEYELKLGRAFTSSSVELTSMGSELISFCDLNYAGNEVTHLLEVKGDSIRRLMQMTEEYVIWELIATSLINNDKPVLLLQLVIPDTDAMWHVPAIYDGEQYQITLNKLYLDGFDPGNEPVMEGINSDSVQVFEALKVNPYPYDTLLSEGYYLKHQVFRDLEYQDFVQSLALMRGTRKIKEFDAYSFGLPYKNIGYIGADFGQSFVFSNAFGSANPVYFLLVEKKTGNELVRGVWVDADEKEQVLLYLDNSEKLMLLDLISGIKVHVKDIDNSICEDQVIGGLRHCVEIDAVTSSTVTLRSEYEGELILKKYNRN